MRLAAADLTQVGSLPPAAKLSLALEIVRTYAQVRRSLRGAELRDTLAKLREPGPARVNGSSASPVRGALRLGRVVRRTLVFLPGDTRCLSQSLVLTRLLAARGLESRLVIAVVPGERFAAHAWVEHDGRPLLPPGGGDYRELVKL
jgi:hypothetical protein